MSQLLLELETPSSNFFGTGVSRSEEEAVVMLVVLGLRADLTREFQVRLTDPC